MTGSTRRSTGSLTLPVNFTVAAGKTLDSQDVSGFSGDTNTLIWDGGNGDIIN